MRHPQIEDDGDVPDMPHMVLQTGEGTGIAITPGCKLLIVEGPELHQRFPFVLHSVSHNKIVLQLANTNYTFKLTSGKPLTLEALKRMKENRTPN